MPTEIITIKKIQDTKSKNGKDYLKLNDKYSIFEEAVIEQVKSNYGKSFSFDVIENGNYCNIRSLGKPVGDMGFNEQEAIIIKNPVQTPIVQEISSQIAPIKQNSRVWGKGSDQVKLYFDDAKDLEEQIRDLSNKGLMPADYFVSMEEAKEFSPDQVLKRAIATEEPQQTLG